jgi:hypothetical protein
MLAGTLYISMRRFRERLPLESQIKDQNVIIRRALCDLVRIGYLDYNEYKKGREIIRLLSSVSAVASFC